MAFHTMEYYAAVTKNEVASPGWYGYSPDIIIIL